MEKKVTITGSSAYYKAREDKEAMRSLHNAFGKVFAQLKALAEEMGVAYVDLRYNNFYDYTTLEMTTWTDEDAPQWKDSVSAMRWCDDGHFVTKPSHNNDLTEDDGNDA